MGTYADVESMARRTMNGLDYSYAQASCPLVDIWEDFKKGDEVVTISHHATCDPDELPVVRGEILTFMVQHGDKYCKVKNSEGRIGFLPISHIGPKEDFHVEPWYLNVCTKKMAEAIVNTKPTGSFIAWTDNECPQNNIILTVKTDAIVDHFKFLKKGCKLAFDDTRYQSLYHAIEEFRKEEVLKTGVNVTLPDITLDSNHSLITDSLILTGSILMAKKDFKLKKTTSYISRLKAHHAYSLIGTLPDLKWYVVKDLVVGMEGFVPAEHLMPLKPSWFHGELSMDEIKSELYGSQLTCSFLVAKTTDITTFRMPYILAILDPQRHVQIVEIEYKSERVSCFNSVKESIVQLINGFLNDKTVPMIRYAITNNDIYSVRSDTTELDIRSMITYFRALEEGTEKDFNIRLMLLGHFGVGKTTVARRLLQEPVDNLSSTDGIETSVQKARIDIQTGEWIFEGIEHEHDLIEERMVHVVRENSRSESHNDEANTKVADGYASIDDKQVSDEEGYDTVFDVQMRKKKEIYEARASTRWRISSEGDAFNKKKKEKTNVLRNSLKDLSLDKRKRIKSIVKRSSKEGTHHGYISIWDFAGQYIYYATHQVFLATNAIYLLMLDMSKSLDDIIEVGDYPASSSSEQPGRKIKDFIELWLQSIHAKKDGEIGELPPVILVGTHKDKLPCDPEDKESYINNFFESVRSLFDQSPLMNHIQPEQICLNNTEEGSDIRELKATIFQVAKRMPWWGKLKPAKWINLEQVLISMAKGSPIAYVKDILEEDKKTAMPLQDEDEVRAFLNTQHNSGSLLYFEDAGLEETVILRPQWIIDAFKSFILSLEELRRFSNLRPYVNDIRQNGVLHKDFLDQLWEQNEYAQFRGHKDVILLYLKKFCILAGGCTANGTDELYFVPSLLPDCDHEHKIPRMELDASQAAVPMITPAIFIKIDSSYYHPTLFPSLLGDCLGRWRVMNHNNTYTIHNKGGMFVLDKSKTHVLLLGLMFLAKGAFYIMCRVVNVINKNVDRRKSDEVRRFVVSALVSHMHLPDPSSLELLIQCTHPDVVNILGSLSPCEVLDTYSTVGCHGHSTSFYKNTIDSENLLSFWYPNGYKKDDYSSLKQWIDKAPEYVNDRALTEKDFERLAIALGFGWEHLGISLGVSHTEMDQCKLDYPQRTDMQIYAMLKRWKRNGTKSVTFLTFVKALFENERVRVDWDRVKNVGEGVYD